MTSRDVLRMLPCVYAILSISYAQTTGTILGKVLDPGWAAVSGGAIVVDNVGPGLSTTTATNSDGDYIAPSLPPGMYKVTVKAPGFKIFTQSGITVEVGLNSRLDARLELGSVTETIDVVASAVN